MLALPAAADGGRVRLSDPAVSPDSGTTDTAFTFTVTYRDRSDSPPQSVQVVIGGVAHAMAADGHRWKKGVTFSVRMTLPAGEHDVLFAATDAKGHDVTAEGHRVAIHAPSAAKPEPTPDPPPSVANPDPEPTPAPAQTAAPKPKPTQAAVRTVAPKPTATPAPPPPAVVVAPTATPDPTEPPSSGTGVPPVGPTPPDGPAPGDRGSGEATAGLPGGWGDLTRHLEAFGLDPAGSPFARLIPVMIWTSGGVALAMAFGIFGKRRRDGEPPEPDEVLSAKAARGSGEAATAALVPEVTVLPGLNDAEAAMPRWRRPSLLQARKADPLRSGAAAARLSFDHAAVAPLDGLERRLIRYLVVQLLDTPDEFRGTAIGSLAQGDEVQLLERSGTYWRILSPDGQQGWIHRMTLGDVVGLPAAPTARETWATTSTEAEDVDEDVLVAFMTARGRA